MPSSEFRVGPEDWPDHIAEVDGPQLVVGGPGSGKTEFLARRAHHLIAESGVAPDHVILLSFSRRGAADLRERVEPMLNRSLTRVAALTFHSLALQVIEQHGALGDWPAIPSPLTGPEHVGLVAEILAGEDPTPWPLPYRPLLGASGFASEVADFCMRAAERLIGPDEIAAFDRADWRGIPGFMERYREALIERGRIDYGSLLVEAVSLLQRPEVREALHTVPRHVLVDEYQDTTVAQSMLLEALVGPGGNLTAAGDPYQSIYSFRGAELGNVAAFTDRFGTEDRPARRLVLTTSFRVPARILDAAVRVTAGAGLPGAAGPVEPAPGEGSVETYRFDQQSHEAEWIASEIERAHLRDQVPYHRMGVLVRSKRGLIAELSRALDRRGIRHDRPTDRLVELPAVRFVSDLVAAAVLASDRQSAAVRRVLLGPFVGMSLAAARQLERSVLAGASWTEALTGGDATTREIAALIDDPSWATTAPAADGFWHVWTAVSGLAAIVDRPDAEDDRLALASFSQALERLGDRDPAGTLWEYFAVASSEDFEAEPLLEYRATGGDAVTLTTLHQAKGLDLDIVFIADAREGVLPDLRSRDSILGARHLSPGHSGDDGSYARFRVQEEMRLVYTAMCRSRLRVVITCTSADIDGMAGAPSRILSVISGTPIEEAAAPPDEDRDPVTAQEAEAWLRRIVRNPTLRASDRLAALAALSEPGDWKPRPTTAYAGVLERGPDTGIVAENPRMSPSRAEAYETCPRRYALERELGVGQAGSPYATLGTLIHAALEDAERVAADRGDHHASLDEALDAIDRHFDPADFGYGPWAAAWRRRAERIVTKLYAFWPGKGPAVGFEAIARRDIDGVEWMGKIDRLERRGDTVWVVDYKTGTTVPKVADAAESLQLGFYASAVNEGTIETADDDLLPDDLKVGGAEMWFPADRPASTSVTTRALDLAALPAIEARLRSAQEGIIAEAWEPLPGVHCERCTVRTLCPMWPEGAEAFSA